MSNQPVVKIALLLQLTLFLIFIICLGSVSANSNHTIWPHPQHLNMSSRRYYLLSSDDFTIVDNTSFSSKCDMITSAIKRYRERLFIQNCGRLNPNFQGHYFYPRNSDPTSFLKTDGDNFLGVLRNVTLTLSPGTSCEKLPHLGMKEEYFVTVDERGGGAEISAHSVWGLLRGLDTFSQMLTLVGRNQYTIHAAKVLDAPRFAWRGLMIDSARHYLPLHVLFETLDIMEANKLNVLHWHLVDDQSFPFVSTSFPSLSKEGAFDPQTHIYTPEDVQSVIDYARLRGIRVLAEFDTPGHTLAWGKGVKGLLTQCFDKQGKPVQQDMFGVMDVTLNSTYDFVRKFFAEVVSRFPDQYQHLGGDEVNFTCWASNPAVREFMKRRNLGTDYRKLEAYYIQRLVDIVSKELKRSYVVWQEVFDDNITLKADTVVHVWKGREGSWPAEVKRIAQAGLKMLVSSPWYLNYISYGTDWPKYYQAEPTNFDPASPAQKRLILGGEACMWGEWVDASNLISRTWPRASAVAERLWSPAHVNNVIAARPRYHAQHCRLQLLGHRVQPNEGPGFCKCDYAM